MSNPDRLLEVVHIGIRSGETECPAHRNHLPLVMEGVSENVMKDQRGSAYRAVSIGEAKFGICVQLSISERSQVRFSTATYLLLKEQCIRNAGEIGGITVSVVVPLEDADPKAFAVQDVGDLLLDVAGTKVGHVLRVLLERQPGKMIKENGETCMSPVVEFPNAIECEHCSLSFDPGSAS